MVDKKYCMSSFLMFRTIADDSKCFKEGWIPNLFHPKQEQRLIYSSQDLEAAIKEQMEKFTYDGKAALALSGGIDSAILAKYMPKGSKAYTFRCVVPGTEVVNEADAAAIYAKECGLEHEVIDIYWEDMEKYAPILMKHKGMPIHSIEVLIYKLALKAKQDGFEHLIFGETCDANFGGLSKLLSRDWAYGEFIDRYTYVKPYWVMKDAMLIETPYKKFESHGYIDPHEFLRNFFFLESMGSYTNACETAGIVFETPYAYTRMAVPIDYARIRAGENKYWVREIFSRLYEGFLIPDKLPMPRAVNEWFSDWKGPVRDEFYPNCINNLSGDQRWLLYSLETFLNILDNN